MIWGLIIIGLFTLFSVASTKLILADITERSNPETPSISVCSSDKPNFSVPGLRISEAKCNEYVWAIQNQEACKIDVPTRKPKRIGFEPAIFGGRPARANEFGHMGAVGWRILNRPLIWSFKCGSTLISEKFLLTAAHCTKLSMTRVPDILKSEPEVVRLGVSDINIEPFEGALDERIKSILPHPSYNSPKKYFDIALIELVRKVKFAKNIQPACLGQLQDDANQLGKEAILTGWGYTERGDVATILQVAYVDVIETPLCDIILERSRNRNWRGFQDHQMCAGKLEGGIDTCQGDSGGPLQIRIPLNTEGKIYKILGITSFGVKCGQKNSPGIYTRVTSFLDWIENNVWGQNA